jgi:hypothetical protein
MGSWSGSQAIDWPGLTMTAAPRTAFVFAGGGSLRAARVGMLEALVETGLKPDFVVGCSVGALARFGDRCDGRTFSR